MEEFIEELDSANIKQIILGMKEDKLEALRIGISKLYITELFAIITSMEEDKLEALRIGVKELRTEQIIEIISAMENEQLEAVKMCKGHPGVANIIKSMTKGQVEALEIHKNDLKESDIAGIIIGFDDVGMQLRALSICQNQLKDYVVEVVNAIKSEHRKEALSIIDVWNLPNDRFEGIKQSIPEEERKDAENIYKEKRETSSIIERINSVNSDEKLSVIVELIDNYICDNYIEKIVNATLSEIEKLQLVGQIKGSPYAISRIIDCLQPEDKQKAIDICDDLPPFKIAQIILEQEDVDEVLDKYIDRLDSINICRLLQRQENKLELLKKYINKIEVRDVVLLCNNTNDSEKLEIIKTLDSSITNNLLGEILSLFTEYNEEAEKYIEKFIKESGFTSSEFSLQIFKTFGTRVFDNVKNAALFSDESREFFGDKEVYNICKYFIFTGEEINVEEILKNPELFNRYKEFRKEFTLEKQVPGMSTRDAIQEFSGNYELLEECMKGKLTEQEMQMLQATLKEKKAKINKREELVKFPQIRREQIGNLIAEDSQEALVYMLTGMKKDEYDKKVRLYVNDSQIDDVIQNFGEAGADFGVIKAINEMISLIQGMEEKDRAAILNSWNEDLTQEFTEQGSRIASIRGRFANIELTIRKIYGQELSGSLRENTLPKAEQDEVDKDVEVISLKGEKFKLLVHGLNAYGKGTAQFEKREVGKSYICTSLISDKHLARAKTNRYYGFDNIGSNALVLEGNTDIWSESKDGKDNSTEIIARHGVKFTKTDDLIQQSSSYNELVLWREYVGDNGEMREVTPNYIVCFDKITDEDRAEAKRLKIPIVLIDSKAYAKETSKEQEQTEQTEVEMPMQYGETKNKMMDVIREAAADCPAVAQQETMQRIVNYMEREMANEKQAIEH